MKLLPRAKPRFCAAGLNLPLTRGLLSNKDIRARGRKSNLDAQCSPLAERFLRSKKIFAKYEITSASKTTLLLLNHGASRVSLRLVAAEQISQAASFLAALLRCSHSRAVETALGQGMARSMCHSQARKRSKPHRGFAKKALSRPLPEKLAMRFLREPFS